MSAGLDPRPLALARMGLGLATVLNAFEMFALLSAIAEGKVALPVYDMIPAPTTAALWVYLLISVTAGLTLALGWRASESALLSTVLNVGVFVWDQQTYSSHRLLATLLVAYLVFARSDAAWAIRHRPGAVPLGPQLLMMAQLTVCYFFAAISKVNLGFISGYALSHWVREWFNPAWQVFTVLALMTIVVELLLAVGLWLPSARRYALVLGLGLHGSILILMADHTIPLLSFAITCFSVYCLFLTRAPLKVYLGLEDERQALQHRRNSPTPTELD